MKTSDPRLKFPKNQWQKKALHGSNRIKGLNNEVRSSPYRHQRGIFLFSIKYVFGNGISYTHLFIQ